LAEIKINIRTDIEVMSPDEVAFIKDIKKHKKIHIIVGNLLHELYKEVGDISSSELIHKDIKVLVDESKKREGLREIKERLCKLENALGLSSSKKVVPEITVIEPTVPKTVVSEETVPELVVPETVVSEPEPVVSEPVVPESLVENENVEKDLELEDIMKRLRS